MLGFDGERGEQECEQSEGKVFNGPKIGGFGVAAQDETDDQDEMRESEQSKSDPQVEEEVMVECGAVGTGVRGEEPWGKQRGVGEARHAEAGHKLRIARSVSRALAVRPNFASVLICFFTQSPLKEIGSNDSQNYGNGESHQPYCHHGHSFSGNAGYSIGSARDLYGDMGTNEYPANRANQNAKKIDKNLLDGDSPRGHPSA